MRTSQGYEYQQLQNMPSQDAFNHLEKFTYAFRVQNDPENLTINYYSYLTCFWLVSMIGKEIVGHTVIPADVYYRVHGD